MHSVSVAPATATLTNGASVTLTAAVTADAGATVTPIVWSSSNSALAGVDQTGKVTAAAAPAAGSVGICAAVGGASGCATVLVIAGAGTTPATISIQSITAGNLNTPVAIPPGGVAGQIDVRLNVTANSVNLDSVTVTVDGATAGKQTFSAAQSAALLSGDGSLGAQTGPSSVLISVNTAAFNATSGAVSWKNGLRAIGARAFGKFAGT
ncbi:MAG: Ig domain-containing protein, partial [Gemmatimonadales bacterium]